MSGGGWTDGNGCRVTWAGGQMGLFRDGKMYMDEQGWRWRIGGFEEQGLPWWLGQGAFGTISTSPTWICPLSSSFPPSFPCHQSPAST